MSSSPTRFLLSAARAGRSLLAAFCLTLTTALPTAAEPLELMGASSQFVELVPKRIARDTPFYDRTGKATSLSAFRGQAVLVNFWATWCVPCIAEMPSLDRLAGDYADTDLSVLTISVDRGGLATAIPFYRRFDLNNLPVLVDPDHETAHADRNNPRNAEFALYGLPITYAIDRNGRILGYITGRVDWQSTAAETFIASLRSTSATAP